MSDQMKEEQPWFSFTLPQIHFAIMTQNEPNHIGMSKSHCQAAIGQLFPESEGRGRAGCTCFPFL